MAERPSNAYDVHVLIAEKHGFFEEMDTLKRTADTNRTNPLKVCYISDHVSPSATIERYCSNHGIPIVRGSDEKIVAMLKQRAHMPPLRNTLTDVPHAMYIAPRSQENLYRKLCAYLGPDGAHITQIPR